MRLAAPAATVVTKATLATLAASALMVAACGSGAPHPPYSAQPSTALIAVKEPPPPARVEEVPTRPRAGVLWIDGEWTWRRGRWSWLPGRWIEPPGGATFSPWAYVRGPDAQVYYAPGVWRDKDGKAIAPPDPIAMAVVDTSVVVSASGETERIGRTPQTKRNGQVVTPAGSAAPGGSASPDGAGTSE